MDYVERFKKLRPNKTGGLSPHKMVMVLTVIELAEQGRLTENKIFFSPALRQLYKSLFDVVANPRDKANPHFPFFHLQERKGASPFWHLKAHPGQDAILEAASTPKGPGALDQIVAYAYLNEDLYQQLMSPTRRLELKLAIIDKWFPAHRGTLLSVAEHERDVTTYSKWLQSRVDGEVREDPPEIDKKARDPAFARTVREAYDYRCSITGWRVLLDDGTSMVEAAHLIPHSETQDDDPRNGIALSPTFHWAMDKNLIAPGPDMKWHVSKLLDKRNRDYAELIEFDKSAIMLPKEKKFYPKKESLEWRMDMLAG